MLKQLLRKVSRVQKPVFRFYSTKYTPDHEYVLDGKIGISAHAADALGEVIHLEVLVEKGEEIECKQVIAEIESVKSVSEIYSPVCGTVVDINEKLLEDEHVTIINEDPENGGWMVEVDKEYKESENLMEESAYETFCEEEHH